MASQGKTTLLYELHENAPLSFEEFDLIIRSLHGANLINYSSDKEAKSAQVEVAYYANMSNARGRLGRAGEFITVSRLSDLVRPCELQALQLLRARFGFGGNPDEEEPAPSTKPKKRRYPGGH